MLVTYMTMPSAFIIQRNQDFLSWGAALINSLIHLSDGEFQYGESPVQQRLQ